jgi:hypothetical protein
MTRVAKSCTARVTCTADSENCFSIWLQWSAFKYLSFKYCRPFISYKWLCRYPYGGSWMDLLQNSIDLFHYLRKICIYLFSLKSWTITMINSACHRPYRFHRALSFWLQIQRSWVRFPALPDFSENQWVWNGVYSASWGQLRSYLEEKVAAPVQKTEINDRGNPLRWPRNTLYPQKLALLRQQVAVALAA